MICGVLMCKACRTAHENLPVTRCHEVVHVPSGGPSPLKLLESFQPSCAHHGRDLAYACATCGVFACHCCLMPSHVEHEVVDLTSLRQSKRKACSTLQRALKQHALSVKSTRRRLEERLARTSQNCRALCDAIQACASHNIDQIATRASEMKKSVRLVLKARKEGLEKDLLQLQQVERNGNRLRCVLTAVTQKTPHLTSLTLLHTCQAKFEALQQQRPLQGEDFDSLAFCKNLRMEAELLGESFGSVRHVRQALSEKVVSLVRVFQTHTKLSDLAITPYGEIVCVSRFCATCHVWDEQGVLLLVDASLHVNQPTCVEVTPDGVIVVLDVSSNGENQSTSACLKFLSPSGSFLSQIGLSCDPDRTWFHVPDSTRVLISDGANRKVTMVGLNRKNRSLSCVLHTVEDEVLLSCPRHVAMTITEDLLVSDGGTTLRVISPGGHINTLLTEDEPFMALVESDGTAQRALISVCCDRHGRVLAADSSKCGLYVITGAGCREGERHFVSLREASSACTRLTAMTVCRRQGLIFVAMEDGQVSILRLGNNDDSDDSDGDNYVNLWE
ncbi:hypothetical protein C0Q70_20497 [Pomacea canaliculata]|uniref:B box-type domain-containing protein n=1 Tax=Pomacea canaliculata TaxID=400727 RepID=A0A2T7NFP9_POMCA|nr:uncharacterized protein LOC112553580 [Pomacea canaliculata]XP_025076688.1 uncharacterized protein LOC112553580 [Pomacea canaliculata]PVD20003.1 hypothetical protein C0Q70_20497 [Pomacea canaliculata]